MIYRFDYHEIRHFLDKELDRETPHEIATKVALAAEQMRAAGDIENNFIRRIEADERCEAIAPVGDGAKQKAIRRRMIRKHNQRMRARALRKDGDR